MEKFNLRADLGFGLRRLERMTTKVDCERRGDREAVEMFRAVVGVVERELWRFGAV